MRLTSILCLLLLVAPCAFADSASSSRPPDIAVSPITYMPAAGSQTNPRAASNGDVTLVAWSDARNGNQAYAARIAGDDRVLDPLGIPLGIPWGPDEVVWNGDSFAVLGRQSDNNFVLLLVGLDGAILDRKSLGNGYARYAAATGDGADVRFLFLMSLSYGGGSTVVDGKGNIVGGATHLWPTWQEVPNPVVFSELFTAGPTESGFVVMLQTLDYNQRKIYTALFDQDGHIVSTIDAQLPFNYIDGTESVVGGSGGILLSNLRWIGPAVAAFRLDAKGAYTGITVTAGSFDGFVKDVNYQPRIFWDHNHFFLLWRTAIWDHVFAFLAVADPDVSSADKHIVLDVAGSSGATLVRRVAQPLVITTSTLWGSTSLSMNDVYVQRFTPAFEFSSPQLVVSTATQQNGAQVATGSNGYAVAWSEVGPDKNVHAYVRRFTTAGEPYDPQPIEITTGVASYSVTAPLNARLASNGNMYVVAWVDSSKVQLRRLADVPGRWLDPQPVAIDFLGDLALASDGKNIMAVGSAQCPKSGDTGCVGTQRIAIGTDIVPGPRVVAKYSPSPAQYTIASNGTDYLVVWSDGAYPCQITCPSPILSLLALRIRADGTALDPAPQLIEKGSPYGPSAAWNGGRYAVAWLAWTPNRGEVHMATVTPEGAIRDADSVVGGTVVQRGGTTTAPTAVRVVAFDTAFALLTRTTWYSPNSFVYPTRWDYAAICATCSVADLLAAPRTELLYAPTPPTDFGSFDAASRGNSLVLAYDRTGEPETGFVPRVYSRTLATAARRRSSSH